MCGCMHRSVAGKIAADSSPFSVTFFHYKMTISEVMVGSGGNMKE